MLLSLMRQISQGILAEILEKNNIGYFSYRISIPSVQYEYSAVVHLSCGHAYPRCMTGMVSQQMLYVS